MYRVLSYALTEPLTWGWRIVHAGPDLAPAERAYRGLRVREPLSVAKALARVGEGVEVLHEERAAGGHRRVPLGQVGEFVAAARG